MPHLFLVMGGGAIGAGLRFLLGRFALHQLGPALPWGTLLANVVGGFAMGLLAGTLARFGGNWAEGWRLFLGVGLLGGFTTFSAFSLETVNISNAARSALPRSMPADRCSARWRRCSPGSGL